MKKYSQVAMGLTAALLLLVFTGCSKDSYAESSESLTAYGLKANKLHFNTSLKGRNEVPANNSRAAGQTTVKIAKDELSLHYKMTAANIDNVIQAHFHVGEEGVNGPVVAFLFLNPSPQPSGPQNGVLAEGTITASEMIGPLAGNFEGLLEAMRAGLVYVNVHTTNFPGGEIRGQL